MIENDFALIKIQGDEKTPGLTIDLAPLAKIEQRIPETAFVTPEKAHELLALFNEGQAELSRMITKVRLQLHYATQAADRRRAEVLLDETEKTLATKGFTKSSVDLRQAVLDLDTPYQMARDKVAFVEALVELLKGKQESLKRAYFDTKEVFGDSGFRAVRNIGGEIPESARIGDDPGTKYSYPAGYTPPVRTKKPYGQD